MKKLIILTILAMLVFAGFRAFGAYFEHQAMVALMKSDAERDLLQPRGDLREHYFKVMSEIDPDLQKDDMSVAYSTDRGTVTVNIPYHRLVDLKVAQVPMPLTVDFHMDRTNERLRVQNIVNSYENNSNAAANQIQQQLGNIPNDAHGAR